MKMAIFAGGGGGKPAKKRVGRLPVKTQAARRPWLKCSHCGHRLCQADFKDGKARLSVQRALTNGRVPLYCPVCRTERVFHP